MLNKWIGIGNLGADPEVRTFQNGGQVCNLRLACTEKWKDKNSGEQKERTEWVSVAIFQDGLIGVAERFLKKGSTVYIEGKLQTRKWQDQSGNDRYKTEVVLQGFDSNLIMLDSKQGGGNQGGYQDKALQGPKGGATAGGNDFEDSIPFAAEKRI